MPDPLCRLAIQHGPHAVDLALPRDTPIGLLLPSIVDLVHRGRVSAEDPRDWQLSRVGHDRLDAATSLHDNAIHDGELLLLATARTPAPEWIETDAWHTLVDTADAGRAPTRVTATAAFVCVAVLAASALTWAAVVSRASGHILTAGALTAASAIGAIAVRRTHPDPILCVALSTSAVVFAAVGGFLAVPVGQLAARSLLGAAAACSTSVLLLRVTGRGPVCLTALATSTALTTAALACGVAATLPVFTTGAALSVLALAALAVAARLSIAVAGLAPTMPNRDSHEEEDATDEGPRAVAAHRTLTGLVIGSAGAAALGTALAAWSGFRDGRSWPNVAFAVAVGVVMLLRARTHIDMRRRTALVLGGMAATAAGVALVVVTAPGQANWVCLLLMTSVGVNMLAGQSGEAVNPLVRRAVDVSEYLALAAVVPLACWVGGVYELVRGLSLP
jgi:type VII secretion integral membrane protein EccD